MKAPTTTKLSVRQRLAAMHRGTDTATPTPVAHHGHHHAHRPGRSEPQTMPAAMRAVVHDRYGSADVLRLDSIAVPAAGDGQVLVRVAAAGVDRGTWHLMTGRPLLVRLATGLRRPRNPVPGRDLAGTVVAVGAGVARFAVGDAVFGVGSGTFAEYAVAKEARLAPAPRTLRPEQAAVVPISGMTAIQAADKARLAAGSSVLVLGASGGVGSYAVQIAKARGAVVTGVCSAAKAEFVRALGADHVIAYDREDPTAGGQRYDAIIDIGGNTRLGRLRRMLAPRGTLVIVGGEGGDALTGGLDRQLRARIVSLFSRQTLTAILNRENAADLDRLAALIDRGAVKPALEAVHSLPEAPGALHAIEQSRVRGKLAIRP